MGLPFLEAFTRNFGPAQREALEQLAATGDSALGEAELAALITKVQDGTDPLFEAPEFGPEILDACKVNTALTALRADLSALLSQAQTIEAVSVKHNQLHARLLDRLRQSVLRLDELILTNLHRRLNTGFNDVKFVDFYASQNESGSRSRARVEPDTGVLISGVIEGSRYAQRGGELRPRFTSNVLSTGTNPDFGRAFFAEDAARDGHNYVWADVLLADSRIEGEYNSIQYDGAVVELEVLLPQPEDINEIKLASFGRYPLNLIALEYDNGSAWQSVGVTLPLTLELDNRAIRFDTINALKLKLVFHQPEFRQAEYLLEAGQLKRTNYLNLLTDKALQVSINDQGRMPAKLRDDRRQKAKLALEQQLGLVDSEEPVDRYRQAVSRVVDIDSTDLIRISKFEYVVGLRTLEVNYKRYAPSSDYNSPALQATGAVFNLALQTEEVHTDNDDGHPVTAVEWQLDVGGGNVLDIVPDNADLITEVLEFDTSLVATTRFIENDSSPSRTVYKDGRLLTITTDYTLSSPAAGQPATVTLEPEAWSPASTYYIVYRPSDDHKFISIQDLFDSIKPPKPDRYYTTGELNRLSLKAHPVVVREMVTDKTYWTQPDPTDALWVYQGPAGRTDEGGRPLVVRVDGENYGIGPPTMEADNGAGGAILPGTTNIRVQPDATLTTVISLVNAFPSEGVVEINNEQIYYREIAHALPGLHATLGQLTRGYNNTAVAASHAAGSNIQWVTRPYYAPIHVTFNGLACTNITNYEDGRHPAFTNNDGPPQYIQIGNSLYFDRPLQGIIDVWYRRLVDHMVVRAKLRALDITQEHTPVVTNYILKCRTATL